MEVIQELIKLKEELYIRINKKENKKNVFDKHQMEGELLLKNSNIKLTYRQALSGLSLSINGSESSTESLKLKYLYKYEKFGQNYDYIKSREILYDWYILHFHPELYDNIYTYNTDDYECYKKKYLLENIDKEFDYDEYNFTKETYKRCLLEQKPNYSCNYCGITTKYPISIINHSPKVGGGKYWRCSKLNHINAEIYSDIPIKIMEEYLDLLCEYRVNDLYIDKIKNKILETEIKVLKIEMKEIEKGKQEIEKGKQEIEKGKREIEKGKREIEKGKREIEIIKNELEINKEKDKYNIDLYDNIIDKLDKEQIRIEEKINNLNNKEEIENIKKEQINKSVCIYNIEEKLKNNEGFMYTMSYYLLILTIVFCGYNTMYINILNR